MESDQVFGGEGDDIIEDPFGDNFLRGNQGNDVISSGHGLSISVRRQGNDFLMASTDTVEMFAGEGDDFLLGGSCGRRADWATKAMTGSKAAKASTVFRARTRSCSSTRPSSATTFSTARATTPTTTARTATTSWSKGAGIQRNNGMDGFDWAIHKGDPNRRRFRSRHTGIRCAARTHSARSVRLGRRSLWLGAQ